MRHGRSRADLDLRDANGSPVPPEKRDVLLTKLYVESSPPFFTHGTPRVILNMPLHKRPADTQLTYKFSEFGEISISLDGTPDQMDIRPFDRSIKIQKPLVIIVADDRYSYPDPSPSRNQSSPQPS